MKLFNAKTMGVIALAAIMGLGAAWAAQRWLQLQIGAVSAGTEATTRVVVATRLISLGQRINEQNTKWVAWPTQNVPRGAFHSAEKVMGRVANQNIYEGEPILEAKAGEHAGGSALSAAIGVAKRAVTIRVNDVVGVAGFVLPGNRIDVLATSNKKGKEGAVTRTVLENMKVLAVDQTTGDKDKPTVVRAVTLEATPEEAEALVQARTEGALQLALRNSLDTKVRATKEAGAPAPKIRYLTVIRGTEVSQLGNTQTP